MQHGTHFCKWSLGMFLLCALLAYGCSGDGGNNIAGGGGGGGGGQSTAANQEQVTDSTLTVIDRVLDILIGDDASVTQARTQTAGATGTRQEPVSLTIACGTGEVSFNGEVDVEQGSNDFAIDGTLSFANCDGISGNVGLDSAGTVSGSSITIGMTLDGPVSAEGCDITFDGFMVDTTADSLGRITSPVIAVGTIRATCNGDSIVCTPNNIDITDRSAFEDSCRGA